MEDQIKGLHHITAIASSAQANYDFYTKVLGQRLVKKTVNFDDPGTYHFYFGDEKGTPGSILTFFPWEGARRGVNGTGMATNFGYAVPVGSLNFWKERLSRYASKNIQEGELFGKKTLTFEDPDELNVSLVENTGAGSPWETPEIPADLATRGFHHVTLTLRRIEASAKLLTELFGYQSVTQEGNTFRFKQEGCDGAGIVDLRETPTGPAGISGAGTNHHIAFRVANEEILMHFREKVSKLGLGVTPKIDRDYFFSIYFREPGGVLFEIATDNPGFTKDEPLEDLGSKLKLPSQYEGMRSEIERTLPGLRSN